jgi:hypothetical protein
VQVALRHDPNERNNVIKEYKGCHVHSNQALGYVLRNLSP